MAMDFPARHDNSSLNCRPGMLSCGTSMISVAAEAAALAGINVPPARYVFGSPPFNPIIIAYRFYRAYSVPKAFEF